MKLSPDQYAAVIFAWWLPAAIFGLVGFSQVFVNATFNNSMMFLMLAWLDGGFVAIMVLNRKQTQYYDFGMLGPSNLDNKTKDEKQ